MVVVVFEELAGIQAAGIQTLDGLSIPIDDLHLTVDLHSAQGGVP